MKPENLLVFMDYAVKLGDFGVVIKMPKDDKSETYVKGCTP